MTNLLLMFVVALLVGQAFHRRLPEKPASYEHRFQPISGNPDVALDTKKGNLCATIPPPQPPDEPPLKKTLVLVDGQRQLLPVCSESE